MLGVGVGLRLVSGLTLGLPLGLPLGLTLGLTLGLGLGGSEKAAARGGAAAAEAGVGKAAEGKCTASGLSVTRLAYQRPVERRCSARSGHRMDMPMVAK